MEKDLGKQREAARSLSEDREKLRLDRRRLLGDKSPDEEEKRLNGLVEEAEKRLEGVRQTVDAAKQRFAGLTSKRETLDRSIAERQAQIGPLEEDFRASPLTNRASPTKWNTGTPASLKRCGTRWLKGNRSCSRNGPNWKRAWPTVSRNWLPSAKNR